MLAASLSILLLEDEEALGSSLKDYLSEKGFDSHWVKRIGEAQKYMSAPGTKDWILLVDVGLPDGNGIEFAKSVLENNPSQKILFLSAQSDPETRLQGLETGALDYITKPFQLKELMIRLERLTKIAPQINRISTDHMIIDRNLHGIQILNDKTYSLSEREMNLFNFLFGRISRPVSRDEIIQKVWQNETLPSHRTVDNYIVNLRKLFDLDPQKTFKIKTIRGVGYCLECNGEYRYDYE